MSQPALESVLPLGNPKKRLCSRNTPPSEKTTHLMEEIQYKIESQIENIETSIQTLAYYSGGKHPISFFLKMLYFQTGV